MWVKKFSNTIGKTAVRPPALLARAVQHAVKRRKAEKSEADFPTSLEIPAHNADAHFPTASTTPG